MFFHALSILDWWWDFASRASNTLAQDLGDIGTTALTNVTWWSNRLRNDLENSWDTGLSENRAAQNLIGQSMLVISFHFKITPCLSIIWVSPFSVVMSEAHLVGSGPCSVAAPRLWRRTPPCRTWELPQRNWDRLWVAREDGMGWWCLVSIRIQLIHCFNHYFSYHMATIGVIQAYSL